MRKQTQIQSTTERLAGWAPIFQKFETSGLSQREFCQQERLSFATFTVDCVPPRIANDACHKLPRQSATCPNCMDNGHTIVRYSNNHHRDRRKTMSVTLSIRAKEKQRDLIDQAAERLGLSRTDFMLEVACREAESVLLEQTYFAVSPEAFVQFTEIIENPPQANAKLKQLMQSAPPWGEP